MKTAEELAAIEAEQCRLIREYLVQYRIWLKAEKRRVRMQRNFRAWKIRQQRKAA